MSALAVVLLVVAQAPSTLEVEADFAYGFGARSAFGVLAGGAARWPLYEGRLARGEVEAGLLGGWQTESYDATAALLLPSVVSGANHRVELFAVGGHTVSFLESRRLQVGLLLFAGATHVAMRGTVRNDAQGIDRTYAAAATEFSFGFTLRAGFRLTRHVGVVARFVLPVPWAGVAISSYFMASGGLTVSW